MKICDILMYNRYENPIPQVYAKNTIFNVKPAKGNTKRKKFAFLAAFA